MKKLIAALITLSMLFCTTSAIYSNEEEEEDYSKYISIKDPENYIGEYMTFHKYGGNGYYNEHMLDGDNPYFFDTESGWAGSFTEMSGYSIDILDDGTWYMFSNRIDGYYNGTYYHGEGPVADILTGFPQYEYTASDIDSLQKYLVNPSDKSVLLRPVFLKKGTDSSKQVNYTRDPGYYDYNMNNVYDVTDLAMMKYDVLHNVTKNRNEKIEIQKNSD
jgi:hypothetical protein